jgi:hypothetical protein
VGKWEFRGSGIDGLIATVRDARTKRVVYSGAAEVVETAPLRNTLLLSTRSGRIEEARLQRRLQAAPRSQKPQLFAELERLRGRQTHEDLLLLGPNGKTSAVDGPDETTGLDLAPDGRTIVYSTERPGRLVRMDARTGKTRIILHGGQMHWALVGSGRSRLLVERYVPGKHPAFDLWSGDATSGSPRRVKRLAGWESGACCYGTWSLKSSDRLFLTTGRGGYRQQRLWRLDRDGTMTELLRRNGQLKVVWSNSTGDTLVVESHEPINQRLFLIRNGSASEISHEVGRHYGVSFLTGVDPDQRSLVYNTRLTDVYPYPDRSYRVELDSPRDRRLLYDGWVGPLGTNDNNQLDPNGLELVGSF